MRVLDQSFLDNSEIDKRREEIDKIASPSLPGMPTPTDAEMGIEPEAADLLLTTWQEETGQIWVARGEKYTQLFSKPFQEILKGAGSIDAAQAVLRDAIQTMRSKKDSQGHPYRVKSPAGLRSWTDDALYRYTSQEAKAAPIPAAPKVTRDQIDAVLAWRRSNK